jgi:S-adenosylmethionine:tRNA ribosyltransferase-isomerase
MRSTVRFILPPELEAAAPPEMRGLRRDHVRLLLLDRDTGAVQHHRFDELPLLLAPGDLVVVNDSRTLPASLLGRTTGGSALEVRLAARAAPGGVRGTPKGCPGGPGGVGGTPGGCPGGTGDGGERWAALPLGVSADGGDPALVPTDARPAAPPLPPGERLVFGGGLTATVLGRHAEAPPLVWLAFDADGERLAEALHRAGRPVRYAYVPQPWPLHHYQTLFAAAPGSAEMASAGRPFTVQTVRALRDRGVGLATISLHAGLSTYGDPAVDRRFVPPEAYRVPEATAAAVDRCRATGGRVVAVGTTVVRALETAAAAAGAGGSGGVRGTPGGCPGGSGGVRAGAGVTRLRIGPGHRLLAVDGLLTGLHEPEASHLDLLGAFVDPEVLGRAYTAALDAGYLWHEFGDVCLILGESAELPQRIAIP